MARIAVLGGSGFLGSKVVTALKAAGLDVAVASRRSEVRVDVTKPETFAALAPFEVIIDLSDTVTTPPDALIAECLKRGQTVIEATSDAACVERLHAAHTEAKGRLVLGGGIFTGISNLLARDVTKTPTERVTLGVSSSPFSGAGKGTIELMLHAMASSAVRYENGTRIEEPRMRRGPSLDFGKATRSTGYMSLAEPFMIHHSTGAKTVDVLFAPRPGFLVSAFIAMPTWLARARWFQSFMRCYFTVLRRMLLSTTASAVELVACTPTQRRTAYAADGMDAAAWALTAMTERVLLERDWRGVRFIDDVCDLEPIVTRANQLAARDVITLTPPGRAS